MPTGTERRSHKELKKKKSLFLSVELFINALLKKKIDEAAYEFTDSALFSLNYRK